MTVAELERLLATLPDDAHVLVKGCHIQFIFRKHATTQAVPVRRRDCLDCGERTVTEYEDREVPGSIDIGATIRPKFIYDEPPVVTLHGRWPRAAKEAIAR